jgi:hypothetical protein
MIATLALHQESPFLWSEWSAMLGEEIKKAQAAGDPALPLYSEWFSASSFVKLK